MTLPFHERATRRLSVQGQVDGGVQLGAGGRADSPARRRGSLRVAVLAPPWLTVPPGGYGGIESVVALLCEQLVANGHDVTLFAAPGSRSSARVRSPLRRAHPDDIGRALYEVDHVARAFSEIDAARVRGQPFDVVHDQCGHAALAMADRLSTPMVHTIHGCFDRDALDFYTEHGHKATLVGISRSQIAQAPAALRHSPVVPNPVTVERRSLERDRGDYLLWIGRMTTEKGPHRAIAAARMAGRRLVLAGPVQPGQEAFFAAEVQPHLDDPAIDYVGEVGGQTKIDLFARAAALLMPIRWSEPFGMVMIEALACGTPVLAFPEGAATEIIQHGVNGRLVADEREMAAAVRELGHITATDCRASVASRYGASAVAAGYEAVYRSRIDTAAQAPPHRILSAPSNGEVPLVGAAP
jgi:glycosyltransferase involved in cell wall biosynthesis